MSVVMLYFDDSIKRLMQSLLELEGYTLMGARDPAEAFRLIEANADPCILFTDNFKINPVVRKALKTLQAMSTLRQRVWVIGLDIESPISAQFLADGLLDDFLAMPFTPDDLIKAFESATDKL